MQDAFGSVDYQGYMDWGLGGARTVGKYLNQLFNNNEKLKIIDWGCGPARVIRFLDKVLSEGHVKLWGCDYNKKSIEWCKKYINNCQFKTNNLEPPPPFRK